MTGIHLPAILSVSFGSLCLPAPTGGIGAGGDEAAVNALLLQKYHRLISTVLEQAVKEGHVPFNVAARATLPKAEHKDVNYFQLEQVAAIREALEQEPMKWKTLVHLLLITGGRRGEVLGLKWDKVDFEGNRIFICNNILYRADVGIYESSPKTERSRRYVALPYDALRPFPLPALFCLARICRIGGRDYVVYAFDSGERPVL